MNRVTLVGHIASQPIYYCTTQARDILRLQLITYDRRGNGHSHYCLAHGPAAIDLHTHLAEGNQLMVVGELLYRDRLQNGRTVSTPYIMIRQYTYLDEPLGSAIPANNLRPCVVATLS